MIYGTKIRKILLILVIQTSLHITANVQLISNNHDLENRMIITCKPVHMCKRVTDRIEQYILLDSAMDA